MKTNNLEIFSYILSCVEKGQACWLCTVTNTWGSSPRPQGSLMAVNAAGEQIGSLSGGCIEEELIAALCSKPLTAPSFILYGASNEEAERLQLPCGGTVGVLIEPMQAQHKAHCLAIIDALKNYRSITRNIDFVQHCYTTQTQHSPFIFEHNNVKPQRLKHVLGAEQQLFIIGATDVAQAVAELAVWMNYKVTVCDPRADKIQQWPIEGCTLLAMLPDEALESFIHYAHLAIVALTHDPRIDDMGLLKAFETQAHFIGAMGSLKTSHNRRQRLLQLGISQQQLTRLHAPVGACIGSKTPREIAVAIMSQLIQLHHQRS
jgi:xanthine dehydrogenase accessory factor